MEAERKRLLKPEGNLTIYEAGRLKELLMESFQGSDVLEIDLSEVKECDTSGLQVLCSAKKTADKEGKKVTLEGISKSVKDTMIITGITYEMIANDGGAVCLR